MSTPNWISHRGFHKKFVENSREAFSESIDLGFSAVETDLQISFDDQLVLSHDPTLDRVFGDSTPVRDYRREELEVLNGPKGEKLLFFDDFAREFWSLDWTLDIKPNQGLRVISALFKWADSNERIRKLQDSKFLFWNLSQEVEAVNTLGIEHLYARKSECEKMGVNLLTGMSVFGNLNSNKIFSLPEKICMIPLFKPKYIEVMKLRGFKSLAFLPSTESFGYAAIECGFDEILTNGKRLD